ncbi:MAG: hypothetical protein JW915_17325 [Chitinispirillaceae bacterium]|nr:hypothetical protein [Chitinispirillaceae bacterium]
MIIHNLRNSLPIEVKKKTESGFKNQSAVSPKKGGGDNNSSLPPSEQFFEERRALLLSIKSKIKSGFYDSDAVLDDLSHGFASALDQTV